MLRAVAHWHTAVIAVNLSDRDEVLTVSGFFEPCHPELVARHVAAYVGTTEADVTADTQTLVVTGASGTFHDPPEYMAWVDEAVSAAERDTQTIYHQMVLIRQVIAVNIAQRCKALGLTRAGLCVATACDYDDIAPVLHAVAAPPELLVRIATALHVTVEELTTFPGEPLPSGPSPQWPPVQ